MDLIVGFAVAFLASWATCKALLTASPMDAPNTARKTHVAPTPTSGGVGIAFGLAVSLVALAMFPDAWRYTISTQGARLLMQTLGFAYAFLLVGFIDDSWPLGPMLKIVVFAVISLLAAATELGIYALPFGDGRALILPATAGLVGTALWVFVLVNSVNFLDGVNGLAMGSMAIAFAALGIISLLLGAATGAGIGICGAGALCGFLLWNFPFGRLFAGDSGALFVGAVGALTSLLVIRRTGLSPFVPPIVFFPILADALLTLAWRVARGAKLLEGHAEHVYQRLLRLGWSHTRVSLAYWAATAFCGVLAIASTLYERGAYAWIVLAALVVAAVVVSAAARRLVLPAAQ